MLMDRSLDQYKFISIVSIKLYFIDKRGGFLIFILCFYYF